MVLGVVLLGFASYSAMACLAILSFALVHYQPRSRMVLAAIGACAIGLSIFPTYMRARSEIRRVVWGETGFTERLETIGRSVTQNWTFFGSDFHDDLLLIDGRLNQNYIVGMAVAYMSAHRVPFAEGDSILHSFQALVPRAIWPDKPVWAGSRGIVTRYAGMEVDENTSVGVGHVLELYINFGEVGVFVGYVVIGLILLSIDLICARYLLRGDYGHFILWLTPALPMIQTGGNFAEVTAGAAGSFILCFAMVKVILRRPPT